jgi:hypothetical protein
MQHVQSHHSFNQGLRQYCTNDTILLTNCRTYNSSNKSLTQNCTHKACAAISVPQPHTWGRVGIARSLYPTRKCNISTYTTAKFGTRALACTIMSRTLSNTYNTSKTGCLKLHLQKPSDSSRQPCHQKIPRKPIGFFRCQPFFHRHRKMVGAQNVCSHVQPFGKRVLVALRLLQYYWVRRAHHDFLVSEHLVIPAFIPDDALVLAAIEVSNGWNDSYRQSLTTHLHGCMVSEDAQCL